MEPSPTLRRVMPIQYRIMMRLVPWLVRKMVGGYYINRFELGKPAGVGGVVG